jgi:hypothetical protein
VQNPCGFHAGLMRVVRGFIWVFFRFHAGLMRVLCGLYAGSYAGTATGTNENEGVFSKIPGLKGNLNVNKILHVFTFRRLTL